MPYTNPPNPSDFKGPTNTSVNHLITTIFVERPLARPKVSNKYIYIYIVCKNPSFQSHTLTLKYDQSLIFKTIYFKEAEAITLCPCVSFHYNASVTPLIDVARFSSSMTNVSMPRLPHFFYCPT